MAGSKLIDWLETEANKRDIQNSRYPMIWKKELCLRGECRAERTEHRWSIPFTSPMGLTAECYDCHKSRLIKISS